MSDDTKAADLRALATSALEASGKLGECLRGADRAALAATLGPEDGDWLERLVVSRVDVLFAFDLLCRVAPERATKLLVSRYLGKADPDTQFGGYVFELAGLLDDWTGAHGKDGLRRLLSSETVSLDRRRDARVQKAIRQAVGLDDDEDVDEWLAAG